MDPTSNHFSLEYLTEFVDGRLSPEAHSSVAAHLADNCPECSERVNFLRRLRRAGRTESWPTPPRAVHLQAVRAFRPTRQQSPRRIRPRVGQGFIAAVLAIILVALVWLATPPITYAASFGEVSGRVEVRIAGDAYWRRAVLGEDFLPGSEVRTAAQSRATLIFPNSGRLQLGEDTHIVLNTLTHRDKKWQITLLQQVGQTESQVDPQNSYYLIRTPAGNIAAHGTRFGVHVEADGKTTVNVHEGSVTVTSAASTISVAMGQMAQFGPNATPAILPSPNAGEIPTPYPGGLYDQTAIPAPTQNGVFTETPGGGLYYQTATPAPTQKQVSTQGPDSSGGDQNP